MPHSGEGSGVYHSQLVWIESWVYERIQPTGSLLVPVGIKENLNHTLKA